MHMVSLFNSAQVSFLFYSKLFCSIRVCILDDSHCYSFGLYYTTLVYK